MPNTPAIPAKTEKQSVSRNGGARRGAGRKAGVPNRATQARQKRISQSGITPLDLMITIMRDAYAESLAVGRKLKAARKVDDKAALHTQLRELRGDAQAFAAAAAPYVHPKLQSVLHGADPSKPHRVVHEFSPDTMARVVKWIRTGQRA